MCECVGARACADRCLRRCAWVHHAALSAVNPEAALAGKVDLCRGKCETVGYVVRDSKPGIFCCVCMCVGARCIARGVLLLRGDG